MTTNQSLSSNRSARLIGATLLALGAAVAPADERRFTYSYEPETQPKGVLEFEQWVTLRTQRNRAVGQENYNAWELREELEYGVTDNYTVALYLNTRAESFRDPLTAANSSTFGFDGVSLENRYLVLNPAEHAVGLALYLEPRYAGDTAEVEEKVILGQRHGAWKWALNLTHATEWKNNLHTTEGELEVTAGLAYEFAKRWSLGLEVRETNELPDYARWENAVVYAGPVLSYHTEKWWAALTVMPQVYGANYGGDPDGKSGLELEGHERLNVRLLFGISF